MRKYKVPPESGYYWYSYTVARSYNSVIQSFESYKQFIFLDYIRVEKDKAYICFDDDDSIIENNQYDHYNWFIGPIPAPNNFNALKFED